MIRWRSDVSSGSLLGGEFLYLLSKLYFASQKRLCKLAI